MRAPVLQTRETAVKATIEDYSQSSEVPIKVVSFWQSQVGLGFLIAGVVFAIALVVFHYQGTNGKSRFANVEPIRFGILTIAALVPILTIIAADVQLGQNSPFGLVLVDSFGKAKDSHDTTDMSVIGTSGVSLSSEKQWNIQIGGSTLDNYTSAIKIPIFVLIFGMLGGYMRFLKKVSGNWFEDSVCSELETIGYKDEDLKERLKDTLEKKEQDSLVLRRVIIKNSMEDLALLFLSPILAVATYFMLVQAGLDPIEHVLTMSVACLATGVITNDVLGSLESFGKNLPGISYAGGRK